MFRSADRIFIRLIGLAALCVIGVQLAMALFLGHGAWPILAHAGWRFLTDSMWNPVLDHFGALPILYGTLLSSLLALCLAAPLGIGIAIFLAELAPRWLRALVGPLVELLAAIPSVIYGLWGIFVLIPWLRDTGEPHLIRVLGVLPLFRGPPYGIGLFAAGVILAIMILPIITALSRDVLLAVPNTQREAALALGATRWEVVRIAVLRYGRSGLLGAIFLGLGRALGETMAVTMVIGNRPDIAASLFAPAQTMASLLANEFAEATGELHRSALFAVGLLLFAVTFGINALARVMVSRFLPQRGSVA